MTYIVENHDWKHISVETSKLNHTKLVNKDRLNHEVVKCVQKCRASANNEEIWGTEIRRGVRTYLQTLLLEKGADWVPQLGGTSSPFAVNYSCKKNKLCCCIPIRADKWMRFATNMMEDVTQEKFLEIIDGLKTTNEKKNT